MVDFLIDKRVLGMNRHLLVSDKGAPTLVDDVPQNVWHLSGEPKLYSTHCLDTLLRLEGYTISTNPPEKYVRSMGTLMSGSLAWPPPWKLVMRPDDFKSFLKTIVSRTVDTLPKLDTKYYMSTYVEGNDVFAALQRARIDGEKWRNAVISNPKLTMVKSFKPLDDGFAAPVVYDRFGTRTGRLTVLSGPSMLTLRKDLREQIILPTEAGDELFYLDYSALEMRVLLYQAGLRCDDPDLYEDIKRKYLPDIDRNIVKGAVIGSSYGLSKFAWAKKLNVFGKEMDHIDEVLKSQFKSDQLLRKLKQQYVKQGFIRNHFDRRVAIDDIQDHLLVNSFAQSTGADVALMGFKSLLPMFAEKNVKPLFLLHDAIIVSAPRGTFVEDQMMKIHVPGYIQAFLLRMNRLVTQKTKIS